MDRTWGRVIVLVIAAMVVNAAFTLTVVAVMQRQTKATQAAAQKTGAMVEQRLCSTLDLLAANEPPAGNPLTNPSRGYDQRNHEILSELGPDLGCGHHAG
jgi:hypothetical protein